MPVRIPKADGLTQSGSSSSEATTSPDAGPAEYKEPVASSYQKNMSPPASIIPHYHGHRARLRSRFLEGGSAALADYELLELVLFRALPRRDVKELAKSLILRFGSFSNVITTPDHLLREVKSVGDSVIAELRIVEAAAQQLTRQQIQTQPLLSSWEQVIAYCHSIMAFEDIEKFRILFLDKQNRLIRDEVQQQGTVSHTSAYPREIIRRALLLNASALILVHNHPSGNPTPSAADINLTQQVMEAAEWAELIVHDHIIVGRSGHVSLRSQNLM